MTAPGATRRRPTARLAGIGLLAAGVAVALYVAGRLHTPNYTFSLFGRVGQGALILKSTLASIALGAAALQVLLALWIYRKLPLAASPPRPVRLAHRIIGFALFALTVPIALHCLIAYGVQLTSLRVAVHSLAGCFFYGAFAAKVLLVQSRRLPRWALPIAGGAPSPPDRSESQADQSIHQLPSCLVAFSRQASDDSKRAGGSTVQYVPFPPGGLMIPAMWPLEASTNRTLTPTSFVTRQAACQGTM